MRILAFLLLVVGCGGKDIVSPDSPDPEETNFLLSVAKAGCTTSRPCAFSVEPEPHRIVSFVPHSDSPKLDKGDEDFGAWDNSQLFAVAVSLGCDKTECELAMAQDTYPYTYFFLNVVGKETEGKWLHLRHFDVLTVD